MARLFSVLAGVAVVLATILTGVAVVCAVVPGGLAYAFAVAHDLALAAERWADAGKGGGR